MNKPVMKKEVEIDFIYRSARTIHFYATNDAASEFNDYGDLDSYIRPNTFCLVVDARFDFDEVVEYIKNYG